ncbi:histidine phosphatase family protein [Psychrobacter lutiphocae]|uniref:histidine phosphatase family protein n=1 Tax=Psychrobacter lutiphocae TaxID=540500 RepID=UPI00035C5848|nr:histidine phosphatase family protein [Psychrobacter lutiphocae]
MTTPIDNIKHEPAKALHTYPPTPAHLPESMMQSVKHLPNSNERLLLFTRHSLRERSNGQGFASYDLPLTPKGRVLAKSWGQWLAKHLPYSLDTKSIASPIWRCVDTAQLMQQGAGVTQPIRQESLLVEPGSLVTDPIRANAVFKKIGALNFINAFLQDELDSTKSAKQGGLDLLSLLYDSQPDPGHLSLAVSHDTLLAAFLGVMREAGLIDWDDWPKMMEGIFVWFDDKPFEQATANFIWRGEHFEVATHQLL